MDLVLCHTTADFDTLGAAVGLACLQPGRRIVLTGGCHPTVQRFLALHRDEYPLIDRRAVDPSLIHHLTLVDAQRADRFGSAADWIASAQQRQVPIVIYDHHPGGGADRETTPIAATDRIVAAVGASTTLVVEAMQQAGQTPTVAEATVMALGIHVDTGSLLYEGATVRDAAALAWLMAQGASLGVVADFVEPTLSPLLQDLLGQAMANLQVDRSGGYGLAWVLLDLDGHVPGLSGVADRLMAWADADALLLGAQYPTKGTRQQDSAYKLVAIGRARGRLGEHLDWGKLLTPLGGGGHPAAAAALATTDDPRQLMQSVMAAARSQLPPPITARTLMSAPVRTIRPDTPITEAQRVLLRYGHSGLTVVDEGDRLRGIISRRDIDLALHHGFGHAPVKGYMATDLKTVDPDTPLDTLEHLMVTYDIGRLPVLDQGNLVGIVTRTDLLRHLHARQSGHGPDLTARAAPLVAASPPRLGTTLTAGLSPALHQVLRQITAAAQERGWHLYLVGGAVRDLLLGRTQGPTALPDLDLVVDGASQSTPTGAGVTLATAIQAHFPEVDLQVHGRFQTAALVWRRDLDHPLAGLMIDIATARTEFYPYPAANPEVEASSIQQDLYRRDFTINALALRLTDPDAGDLLDFFGGLIDLRQGIVRVLHANSFIEDPTRIYRAVRFAVRLDFRIAPQTVGYIRYALASGVCAPSSQRVERAPALQVRLKNELKYILVAPYWSPALDQLDQLTALGCLHPALVMTPNLWGQLRRISRWAQRLAWPDLEAPWLLRLEVLLASVPPADRRAIALALQLPDRSVERLSTLADREHHWQTLIARRPPPSEIYAALHQADRSTLLLASARHPRQLGPAIWRYFRQWLPTVPLVDGHRLQTLGYRPGPHFRPMLEELFAAQLDGTIATVADAATFLTQHYPAPRSEP